MMTTAATVDPVAPNENGTSPDITTIITSTSLVEVRKALEELETELRIKHLPSLIERAPPLEADDIKIDVNANDNTADINTSLVLDDDQVAVLSEDGSVASLRKRDLRTFTLSMIPSTSPSMPMSFLRLTSLDVSNNELMDLPGLATMANLQTLNLERNWFNTLPFEIKTLTKLTTLIASRNFFKPNAASLLLPDLQALTELKCLDLSYNQKCGRQSHFDLIQLALPQVVELKITMWEDVGSVPGSYVGASAAERDARLLRSQLEPWGTVNLRRRLVQDFGQVPTDAAVVDRSGVMQRLLKCYQDEGLMSSKAGHAMRARVHVEGTPVGQKHIDDLLVELRAWTNETRNGDTKRERPSIQAQSYMILRSPTNEEAGAGATPESGITRASRRAIRKAKKLEKYRKIWDLAEQALREVDPVFANRCTEIAVTYGFQGSPHIDKQNCGPFYGFALGNFPSGQGGVCVECSARVVAVVNTQNRLGRVDGRYPHWVDQYDEESERYSLIYYETGGTFVKPGVPVFSIPTKP